MNVPRISPEQQVVAGTRKLLLIQTGIIALAVAAALIYKGWLPAEAVSFGGAMALINTWIAGRRTVSALRMASESAGQEVMILYVGAIQRFVLTVVFFVVGMWGLKLPALPLLAGFALAQGAYFFGDPHSFAQARWHKTNPETD